MPLCNMHSRLQLVDEHNHKMTHGVRKWIDGILILFTNTILIFPISKKERIEDEA